MQECHWGCKGRYILQGRINDNIKRIKNNNKTLGADSVWNEFLQYGGYEVTNKLPEIVNMIFQKE